jgi:hypothetical protein
MADYKELLRKAVQALPENNGAARRAVYEKARSALVAQLRSINPPLAARDITAHRLQLEDCIRQVEQEASEAVIAGMQEPAGFRPDPNPTQPAKLEARPQGKPQPVPMEPPSEPASIEDIIAAAEAALPQTRPPAKPTLAKASPAARATGGGKGGARGKAAVALVPDPEPEAESEPIPVPVMKLTPKVEPRPELKAEAKPEIKPDARNGPKPNGKAARPLPSIVARAEAARNKTQPPTVFGVPPEKPYDTGRRGPTLEPRRETTMPPRLEPAIRVAARQAANDTMAFVEQEQQPTEIAAAMSAVREVEVEPAVHTDPQGAIDRAIATLEREATIPPTDLSKLNGLNGKPAEAKPNGKVVEMPLSNGKAERPVAPPPAERKRGGFSMFGGGSREEKPRPDKGERRETFERDRDSGRDRNRRRAEPRGRDREAPFQRQHQGSDERGGVGALTIFLSVFVVLLVAAGGAGVWAWQEGYLNLDSMFGRGEPVTQEAVVPQVSLTPATPNSTTPEPSTAAVTIAQTPPATEARLAAEPTMTANTTPAIEPLALVAPTVTPETVAPTEERLPDGNQATDPPTSAEAAVAALDPASQAGSQSLLLEAQEDGTTGAVPFSGSVEWSKGTDETGAPTLVGKASIPARNLEVDVLIRKNSDPSLPASHLMEINFTVSDTFIGGSIAHLPGVLLKDEELVQGKPLAGASARVVGNQFLFALSARPEDSASNYELLISRKWIDLAIIYATGRRAIITLEKDAAADQMFRDVFAAWTATASAQ